jgi:hypothetical protein
MTEMRFSATAGRWLQGLLIVCLLVAFFAALVAWEYYRARQPGFLSAAVAECRTAYRAARTAADSAIVDERVPSSGGQKGWTAQRCGFLRESGALR